MKSERRLLLLRIMAVSAVLAFVYTGAVTLRAVFFKTGGGLANFLVFVTAGFSGFMAGMIFRRMNIPFSGEKQVPKVGKFLFFMLNPKSGSRLMQSVFPWLAIVIPLLISYLISGRHGLPRCLFEMVLTAIFYILPLKFSQLAYFHILREFRVYFGFAVFVASIEALYFIRGFSYLRPYFFGAACFFVFVFLILRNQEDIDENIFNKKYVEKFVLPRNLRRSNTVYTLILFLLILLMVNLKPIVLYALEVAGKATVLITKLAFRLLSLLFKETGEAPGDMRSMPEMVPDGQQVIANPVINFITYLLLGLVLLYLAYHVILYVIRKLPEALRKLGLWLRKLFSLHTSHAPSETEEYVDESEMVRPERKKGFMHHSTNGVKTGRTNLWKINDPIKRIRYMYAGILEFLLSIGIPFDKSYTPLEILRIKEVPADIKRELESFTGIYNQVRYGGRVPDSELAAGAEESYGKILSSEGKRR